MSENAVHTAIQSQVSSNPVMLYMKGTPDFPQCGFSSTVVQILNYLGVSFETDNVLASDELRQGIKDFSEWPTVPQLYVKGEFVGGCDIVREMFETGELREFLTQQGIETVEQQA